MQKDGVVRDRCFAKTVRRSGKKNGNAQLAERKSRRNSTIQACWHMRGGTVENLCAALAKKTVSHRGIAKLTDAACAGQGVI